MVSRRPIKVRLKDYKPWQIGIACLLGAGGVLIVCWWSLAPARHKAKQFPELLDQSSGEKPSSLRPPFQMPDFEVPEFRHLRPIRPLAKGAGELERPAPKLPPTGLQSSPAGQPGPMTHLPRAETPVMPDMEVPGAMPGSLPDMAMQAMPGMLPSMTQLSPKFLNKSGGFKGPNPFALMPQGAAPDPEIFARQPQVEMPHSPSLPGMPAPPKGYMNKVDSAMEDARRRLSEPHPGEAPPENFVEPAAKPTTRPHARELPQG